MTNNPCTHPQGLDLDPGKDSYTCPICHFTQPIPSAILSIFFPDEGDFVDLPPVI